MCSWSSLLVKGLLYWFHIVADNHTSLKPSKLSSLMWWQIRPIYRKKVLHLDYEKKLFLNVIHFNSLIYVTLSFLRKFIILFCVIDLFLKHILIIIIFLYDICGIYYFNYNNTKTYNKNQKSQFFGDLHFFRFLIYVWMVY